MSSIRFMRNIFCFSPRTGPLALILIIAAGLVLSFQPPARARVYLDITSPDLRKVPIAVPSFIAGEGSVATPGLGSDLAGLMTRGLLLHGFVKALPASSYNDSQQADWTAAGADFVILGQYSAAPGSLVLEMRLLDILEGRAIFAKRFSGTPKQRQAMILKFCDEVILQLTGERGVSSTKIAYISDETGDKEIHIADVVGSNFRQVTRHHSMIASPRFSPDGSRLAYTSYHRDNANFYITDLAQSTTTRAISRRKGLNLAPAWSPVDHELLVITLSMDGNPDLYLMTTTGAIRERLTENSGVNVSPDFSPDGQEVVFVSDRSGRPQLYIMDMRSRAVRRLTFQGTDNSEPAWSPKGDWIAYTGLLGGNYHLFMIRPQGGTPVPITRTAGDHEAPSWAPDGRQLVFARKFDDERKICIINKNGSNMRVLFDLKGNQSSPRWSPRLD